MKKIIIKAKLRNREEFEAKVEARDLDFSPMYWQHDRVYVPRGYKYGMNYPRLIMRTTMLSVNEAPRYALILRRHIEDSGIDIVEETTITDYTSAANIIMQLGFRQSGEVSRRRQNLTWAENTTLYLDELDGEEPQTYTKIEHIIDDNSHVPKTREELINVLKSLGQDDIIAKSYADLH